MSKPPVNRQSSNRVYVRPNKEAEEDDEGCCRAFTNKINRVLENFFASLGLAVGNNPWKTILISLLLCALCMIGVTELTNENRGEKNWVSQSSDSLKHKDWVDEAFPFKQRISSVLLEKTSGDGDILTKEGLLKLLDIDTQVRNIYQGVQNRQWNDICFRQGGRCFIPSSIMELWNCDQSLTLKCNSTFANVTSEDVKMMLNQTEFRSPITGNTMEIRNLVGVPRREEDGVITYSSVLKISYRIKLDEIFDDGKGRPVDENGEAWEEEFEKLFDRITIPGYKIYRFSLWGNDETSNDATQGDLQFFVIGYILVIIYLAIMLGTFSRINHKVYLALGGIATIGLSIGVAYGLGSGFQLKYTPVHNVLPFLLLGIGVDDIFVIVQTWENIGGPKLTGDRTGDRRTVEEKISQTLRHAGVSVLVTSLTDICAFLVGASTILPALRSFCVWCGIGILCIFLLTVTFFTALLALDAKRQQANRDACCCCCVTISEDWEPTECSKKNFLQTVVRDYYAPVLLSVPGKIISLLIIAGLFAVGVYGCTELEQDFDFTWFLPTDSSPRMYTEKDKLAFPNDGFEGHIYTGQINYYKEYEIMDKMVNSLKTDKHVVSDSVNSWYHSYHAWLGINHRDKLINCLTKNSTSLGECRAANETDYVKYLELYLVDPIGRFSKSSININNVTKQIIASKIEYTHIKFEKAADEIEGMESVQSEINNEKITIDPHPLLPFAYAFFYIGWETNRVITEELVRNLGLALICVFLVTLFLISNLLTSLLVLLCVALALCDIAGFMGFWDLTIDTVTTIILVLAIGLTVDYSAHIGHAFMAARKGDKNERMRHGLGEVGPAVVNGAFSTFLAFVLLAASDSYVFYTFFRVFFLVVLFGMMHGFVFLPVMLSLIGPRPYANHGDDDDVDDRIQHTNGSSVKDKAHQNGGEHDDVQMTDIKKEKNDEEFVVIKDGKGGQANISYTPE